MFRAEDMSSGIKFQPWLQTFFGMRTTPRPSIAEECLWDDVQGCRFRTVVRSPYTDESFSLVFVVFGVFDDNVPITVLVKDICVEQFEFADLSIAVEGLVQETFVWIFRLGYL